MAQATTSRKTAKKLSLQPTYNPSEPMFGMHWTLDGYAADKKALNSMDLVFTALNDLPDLLSMHKIITPYVIRFDGNDKKDPGGYSGFVMIAESHIAIHTFPNRGFVTIDVYTCQGSLDVKTCATYFSKIFGIKKLEENVIERGKRFQELAGG